MLIGIDGNEANVDLKVGISEYAFELLTQFFKFKIQSSKFKIFLKETPENDLPEELPNYWEYRVIGPKKLWTQFALPINLYFNKPRPDVFFTPTHYAPRFSPVPTVVSVMDLSYIHFPELFKKSDLYQLKNWTAYSVKNASKVITISNSSKDDIIKEYGVDEDKVVVIYPGVKRKTKNEKLKTVMQNSTHSTSSVLMLSEVEASKLLKEKYGIEEKFILFVGTLQPRKNIERLIEAFSKVSSRQDSDNNSLQLVIIGKEGWLYESILEAPKKFGVEVRVKFLDFVPDEDLPLFYKRAECFCLPSLYEGFGLPVLEAMQYGCPVITSNVSSLPEAGGNAAVYVNPENTHDIAEKIEKVLNDKKLQEKMRKNGFEQVKKFSWEKASEQTLKVLEDVAKNDHI